MQKENTQHSQELYIKQYDKHAIACKYSIGTKVWLYSPTQLKAGTSHKMQLKYNKLVQVTEQIGDNTYHVKDCTTGDILKYPVDVDNLRDFVPDILHHEDVSLGDVRHDNTDHGVRSDQAALKSTPSSHYEQTNADPQTVLPSPVSSFNDDDSSNNSCTNRTREEHSTPAIPTAPPSPDIIVTPNIGNDTTTNIDEEQDHSDDKQAEDDWYEASSLLKSKRLNGMTYYLVKWSDPNSPPSWEKEDDITDTLKEHFNAKYLPTGKKRKRVVRTRNI